MRLCIISSDYYPSVGGIAAHVYNLSRSLAGRGHSVLVMSIRYGANLPFIEHFEGLTIVRFLVPNVGKLRGVLFVVQASFFIFVMSVLRRFDVIHWHTILPDALIGIVGRAKVKVFTNHSSGFLELFAKGKSSIPYQWLFNSATTIIAPSKELAEKSECFKKNTNIRIQHISNGVNSEAFYPVDACEKDRIRNELSKVYHFPMVEFLILCPRRLEPKNGVEYFVQSIAFLKRVSGEILFLIAGNDADMQYAMRVRSLVEDYSLQHQVIFLGAIPNAKMSELYQISDIVVLPSLMEATSIAGLEAMACGIPLVGTRVGGIPEIIEDGKTGILVPEKNPEALAGAMNTLLANKDLRIQYGMHARQRVLADFSWECISNKTIEVYASTSSGAPISRGKKI
ncbi:MAG: glycosyltransferase family 4 protein [bacterium]|nr:glycosyltransferase family 4 protein [bacterium]